MLQVLPSLLVLQVLQLTQVLQVLPSLQVLQVPQVLPSLQVLSCWSSSHCSKPGSALARQLQHS